MHILNHLTDKAAFDPAAIEAMSSAFEEACDALQVSLQATKRAGRSLPPG
jgi:hypothetical protein